MDETLESIRENYQEAMNSHDVLQQRLVPRQTLKYDFDQRASF